MQKDAKFWDRHAAGYAKKPVRDEAAYQKKLAVTREYLGPEMDVMEFGCGTGSTAITHAPYAKSILGIDISSKMIEIARGKAEAAGVENVTFAVDTIEDFDAPDGSFDVIMGHSILHLLQDRDAAIAKVYRLLKPGGVFVTSTVCLGDRMAWFKLVAPIGRFLGFFPLVKVITANDVEQSIAAAGFSIDHRWQPGKGISIFIVATKAGQLLSDEALGKKTATLST